jgi:hypothetical protein
MNITKATILTASLGLASTSVLLAADAQAPKADAWGVVLPDYISEASFTSKGAFDSNVFAASSNLANRPEVSNMDSFVFTFSPKIAFNGVKLFEIAKDSAVKSLNFGYTGEYNYYEQFASESNAKSTIPVSLKVVDGPWTFSADNSFLYVWGSKHSPFYNTYSAYGTAIARERRNQIQNRFNTSLRYDQDAYFVRAVASSLLYNLLVDHHNPATDTYWKGYQNWVNRSDTNAGIDIGVKQSKDFAMIAGFRYGAQTQDRYPWGGLHVPSNYTRILVGFEGKANSWLSGSVLVGPDYRHYTDAANLGTATKTRTTLYGEANVTALGSDTDSFNFNSKCWHWVSSTGTAAYQDNTYQFTWKHSWTKQLSSGVGVKFQTSRYDYPTVRNDQLYSYPLNLTYAMSKEVSMSLDYQFAQADSRIRGVTGREFDQNLVSFTIKLAL